MVLIPRKPKIFGERPLKGPPSTLMAGQTCTGLGPAALRSGEVSEKTKNVVNTAP